MGILAVDPTSRVSGGAILGDRIRMQAHHGDPGVFIRSMATRGAVGGLARATADLALLLDAAGQRLRDHRDRGRGPGRSGGRRRGGRDGGGAGPRHGRRRAGHQGRHHGNRRHFRDQQGGSSRRRSRRAGNPGVQSLAHRADGWMPPIVRTVATEDTGIAELLAAIGKFPRSDAQRDPARPQAHAANSPSIISALPSNPSKPRSASTKASSACR